MKLIARSKAVWIPKCRLCKLFETMCLQLPGSTSKLCLDQLELMRRNKIDGNSAREAVINSLQREWGMDRQSAMDRLEWAIRKAIKLTGIYP